MVVHLTVLDYGARWFVLSVCFFFLIHLFGDRMHIDGFLGYLLPLLVIVPLNVLSQIHIYRLSFLIPALAQVAPVGVGMLPILGILVFINLVFIVAMAKILPALSASSLLSCLVFAFLFSMIAYSLWLLPPLPPLPVIPSSPLPDGHAR